MRAMGEWWGDSVVHVATRRENGEDGKVGLGVGEGEGLCTSSPSCWMDDSCSDGNQQELLLMGMGYLPMTCKGDIFTSTTECEKDVLLRQ